MNELIFARFERTNRRLWILCIILILTLIATNAGWLYYESQWQYVQSDTSFEVEQDGEENNVSGITFGDNYGQTENQSDK